MAASQPSWLNRNVAGMALTSFLGDACYEMVIAVLPGFLTTIGAAAGALGWIEGVADATASFVKLGAGWYSDRLGHRKGIVALGYFLTGTAMSVFAVALSWPLVLVGRVVGWLGRGIRGPLRDAMLAESIGPEVRGKAFGLHRAADTVGAVVGPLLGVGLLALLPAPSPSAPFRVVFVVSLIPGLASVAAFVLLVQESRKPPQRGLRLWGAMRDLPAAYRRFLRGVGLFGLGDFSHTLLILAAATLLAPAHGPVRAAQLAALLYVLRNVVYAAASYPIGALADRTAKQPLLAAGYGVGALAAFGTAALFVFRVSHLAALAGVFAAAGVYIAAEDALEGAIPADLVTPEKRGTAYGLMGAVNGFGDLGASVLVGTLWTAVSPAVSFSCAGALMLLGTLLLFAGGPASTASR
jgi:MFS family permease